MADISLGDLLSKANKVTGDLRIDVANGVAEAYCQIYHDYPRFIVGSLLDPNTAAKINLVNSLCGGRKAGLPPPPPPPPFTGGQCPILYTITFQVIGDKKEGAPGYIPAHYTTGKQTISVAGPIKFINLSRVDNDFFYLDVVAFDPYHPTLPYALHLPVLESFNYISAAFSTIEIAPYGGLDICGNPPRDYPPGAPISATASVSLPSCCGGSGLSFSFPIAPATSDKIEINLASGYKLTFTADGVTTQIGNQSRKPIPTLILNPEFTATKTVRFDTKETKLGDGYVQTCPVGKGNGLEEWSVKSNWLKVSEIQNLVNQLSILRGVKPFSWTPDGEDRGKVYICEKFDVVSQALRQQIQCTFVEQLQSECEPFRGEITPLEELFCLIDSIKRYISTYNRNTSPMIVTGSNVVVNSFHNVLGRGGYFPSSAATSEGQAIAIRAACNAYAATGDPYWKTLAVNMGNAYISLFYPTTFPPADINTLNSNNVLVAHWLINAKESFISKGPTASDPLGYGYFNLVVNFTAGVGYIPTGGSTNGDKLADVYSVIPLDAELLWKNVFALPRDNPSNVYEIDYWVSNLQLKGTVLKIFPDSKSNSGRESVVTSETVGKIKLVSSYTGQAKVTFSTYTGPTIAVNQGFEAYPMWRALRPTEAYCATDTIPWTWKGYKNLYDITGDAKWQKCYQATQITETFCALVNNPTAWYKKESSSDPFRYPGAQVILVNNDNGYTASRVVGGDKDQWLRLDVAGANKPYPQIQIQNYAVQAIVTEDTVIHVEAATSQATVLDVILSLSSNAFDFSKYYYARIPTPGSGTPVTKEFTYKDFLHWDLSSTVWYSDIAENPVYTYQGSGGTATAARVSDSPDGTSRYVYKLSLNANGGSGYAGAGFVYLDGSGKTLGGKPRFPFKVCYKHHQIAGTSITLNLKYGGDIFSAQLTDTAGGWNNRSLNSSDFSNTSGGHPSDGVLPDSIYIEAIGSQNSETWFYWIGEAPAILPSHIQTYKAVVASKVATAHTFWLGDFVALNSPSSVLKYNPGVPAFTANTLNYRIDSWQGNNEAGYVYPDYHVEIGDFSKLQQVLDYLSDSQDAYTAQSTNKVNGPFCPSYNWPIWFAYTGLPINEWVFYGVDPNVVWEGYYCRPFASVSRAWHLLVKQDMDKTPYAQQAGKIAMKFCSWLYGFYLKRGSHQPPTNFPPHDDPQVNYHSPHFAALALRAAIYCNLAGGSPLITYGVIKASYEYLKSQYVSSGVMAGSFTASQSTFNEGGINYKQNFGFWVFEELDGIALLLQERDNIKLPTCSAPLI